VDGESDGEERGGCAEREESAVGGVLGRGASGEEKRGSERNEVRDDGDLDHGEPEFEAAVAVNAEQVGTKKERGENSDPEEGGAARKPELHVGGRGHHLRSDGDGDGEPVSGAGNEAGPLVEVEISIDAEGAGCGMGAGELAEREGDGPADEGGEDEGEDDRGSGKRDGGGRAEEKAGADRASD